jgi:uncharacterized phage protein gp47/JayE
MPFETPSLPVLIKRTQSDLASDSLRQSDAQVLARTLGGAAYGLYGYLDWIAEQILPDKADESTLERIAALRLNQPRKAAQSASGSVSFTASAGAVLDVDTLLQSNDGRIYKVTSARTTSNGLNSTTIAALNAGSLGNADAGMTLIPVQSILGILGNSFTVLAPGLTGGVARESLESLRSRVIRSYRLIPHGGSASDYETWALEVPGVTRAWCRGNYLGPGTVGLFIMRDDDTQPLGPTQLAEVKDYIEPLRPVTAVVRVLLPVQVPVTYTLRLTPDTSAVRAAVEAQLHDLHNREAGLGDTLLISHIREAISSAAGESDHVLTSPVTDVSAASNQLLTFGGCVWG